VNRRTRQILENLEPVRENLLALSDDIWQSIDHNDAQALEEGVEFKRKYNEKLDTLAMQKVRVYYDREGNTLSVWFDDPKKEHVCEESDDDIVLIKDRRGHVIGFERLNYLTAKQRQQGDGIPLEVQMV